MRRTNARANGRTIALAAFGIMVLCACGPVRLCAQAPDTIPKPHIPPAVHYGKWVALGGSVVFGVMAHSRNQDAEATYRSLQDRCFDDPVSCLIGPDGRYLDPATEGLYTETRRLDRQASRLLIGAEVTFVASAAGFIWELMHRKDQTPTIPFEPRVEQTPTATKVGLTFRF